MQAAARAAGFSDIVYLDAAGDRVSTGVTFGRGDLSVCPPGVSIGAQGVLFLLGGVSPRGPHRDKH